MNSRSVGLVGAVVAIALLASVAVSISLAEPYESREFVAVATNDTDSYERAVEHATLEEVEPTPVDELSADERAIIAEARTQPTESIPDHGDEWHTDTVDVCRDGVLVCDGVDEWPTRFEADADGTYHLHSEMTYYYTVVADGNERIVVLTTSASPFIDPAFVALVCRIVSFVPLALLTGAVTVRYRRSAPNVVLGVSVLGAAFVAWGLAVPSLESLSTTEFAHRRWFVLLSWLAVGGTVAMLRYGSPAGGDAAE